MFTDYKNLFLIPFILMAAMFSFVMAMAFVLHVSFWLMEAVSFGPGTIDALAIMTAIIYAGTSAVSAILSMLGFSQMLQD